MTVRRSLFSVIFWLALVLVSIWHLSETKITNDLTQFMPAGTTEQQRKSLQLLREGPASRLILIALQGAPATDLAKASQHLTEGLRSTNHFSYVENGALTSSNLELVKRYRYLLDPKTTRSSFSKANLHDALKQRLSELSRALPITDRETLVSDPTAAFRSVLNTWQPRHQPQRQYGVWFSSDKQQALIVAITRGSGLDLLTQKRVIDTIHAAFERLDLSTDTQLVVSGVPVFASKARDEIRSSLRSLSTVAGGLVFVFLLLAYRSFRLVLLSGITLLTAFAVGATVTSLLFGNIHGITLVFGITLLGVAIDYPIHYFSHLDSENSSHQSLSKIWPTLRLSVITTCVGYLAFAHRDFAGLTQLSVFTACGLLSAAAVTRWVLPSLSVHNKENYLPALLGTSVGFSPNRPRKIARIVLGAALGCLVVLLILFPPRWETDLAALSPIPASQRQLDTRLRGELGAPDTNLLILIEGKNLQEILESSEQVALLLENATEHGLLSSFDLAARYLPSVVSQKNRQELLPTSTSVEQSLAAALEGFPFKRNAFEPFLKSLAESRSLPPLTLKDVQSTLIGTRIQHLLFKDRHGWQAIVLLVGVTSGFHNWWRQQGLNVQYLNLKQVSSNMLTDFRDDALDRLLLGILAVVVILTIGLRSLLKAIKVLLPILVAVGLTVELLSAIGTRLSLFHLIALLLTTGIGIDYSLFLHRQVPRGPDWSATMHAILVCVISTTTVFGILSISQIPVLRAIGLTVAIGVPLCFLLALGATVWNSSMAKGEAKQQ